MANSADERGSVEADPAALVERVAMSRAKTKSSLEADAQELMDCYSNLWKDLEAFNIKVSGYILVGNAAGIVTVFQYLLSDAAITTTTATTATALISTVLFALGITLSCVAMMASHKGKKASADLTNRATMRHIKADLALSATVTAENVGAELANETRVLSDLRNALRQDFADGLKVMKSVSTSYNLLNRLLKASAGLFLLGLWLAIVAATEHLWGPISYLLHLVGN